MVEEGVIVEGEKLMRKRWGKEKRMKRKGKSGELKGRNEHNGG